MRKERGCVCRKKRLVRVIIIVIVIPASLPNSARSFSRPPSPALTSPQCASTPTPNPFATSST